MAVDGGSWPAPADYCAPFRRLSGYSGRGAYEVDKPCATQSRARQSRWRKDRLLQGKVSSQPPWPRVAAVGLATRLVHQTQPASATICGRLQEYDRGFRSPKDLTARRRSDTRCRYCQRNTPHTHTGTHAPSKFGTEHRDAGERSAGAVILAMA